MRLSPQIITQGGKKQFAVIPYDEFLLMKERLEDAEDLLALRQAKRAAKGRATIPLAEVEQRIRQRKAAARASK